MKLNFALLGLGRIGIVHAQAIAKNHHANLYAVTDPIDEIATEVANKHDAKILSIEEMENSKDIDAVIICTPTNTHASLIEKFARAQKAIFCEKPIDLEIKRVCECLEVVKTQNAQMMLGFNRRFDPYFMAVKKAVDEGQIGDVEMVNIISRDPAAPSAEYIKVSGGIFRDMSIHDLDMARFLIGEEPVSVFATASVLTDPEIGILGDFDSANIILTTKSGKQCAISNSRRATYGYDQRLEVHGSTGMVSAENQRPVSIEIANKNGYTRPPLHDFFMTRYAQAYANEIEAFVQMILENKPATPNGEDGLRSLILAKAAITSVHEGRRIDIPEG